MGDWEIFGGLSTEIVATGAPICDKALLRRQNRVAKLSHKKEKRAVRPAFYFCRYDNRRLEEEVAVVNHSCLLIELLHEAAGCLSGLLSEHLLGGLLVELYALTSGLLEHLEEVSTAVTLDKGLAELTLLGGCYPAWRLLQHLQERARWHRWPVRRQER